MTYVFECLTNGFLLRFIRGVFLRLCEWCVNMKDVGVLLGDVPPDLEPVSGSVWYLVHQDPAQCLVHCQHQLLFIFRGGAENFPTPLRLRR